MDACHEADGFIEVIVAGDPAPDAVQAHVASCSYCTARLELARRIERTLASRPVAAPPPMFTTLVLGRLRRERWRAEQILDWGFNVAVAMGIVLIAVGAAGLIWASGLVDVSGDLYAVVEMAADFAITRVAEQARTFVLAAFLLTLTLGVWWWVEEDVPV